MTPPNLARRIVAELPLRPDSRVLEPSFGDGSFLLALVERFLSMADGPVDTRLQRILTENLWGVELDRGLYEIALATLAERYGQLPDQHNFQCADFFASEFMSGMFDVVVGNPPYGGTFDSAVEDSLDRLYGRWKGRKLKKETYSFFTARSLDWLVDGGSLVFIISDTMLTISTMAGLRARLMDTTMPHVEELVEFSDETSQPTLVLTARKVPGGADSIVRNGQVIDRAAIESTGNLSWRMDHEFTKYFQGPTLGSYIVCSSGMTIGNNGLFVREIENELIREPYSFEFFNEPITLARELERARLNKISPARQAQIRQMEVDGATRRNVRAMPLAEPVDVELPHPDYRNYNKADGGIVYVKPRWAVFWKDHGDAVLTFKKNGNWYLHGVGGRSYFEREGLTWHLISSRLKMRYLPAGCILDSGAPCAFLREDVDDDELWFILGWCLTSTATQILKSVINHTRNIQSKDVERLPYPWWIDDDTKSQIVETVRKLVAEAMTGRTFTFSDDEIRGLERSFAWREKSRAVAPN